MNEKFRGMDTKEFELPDTLFVRDIDSRVFQSIVIQCIEKIEGVFLIEGNLINSFLGRDALDKVRGISIEQDQKNHAVKVKVEVSVLYGVSLPEKAEEIQTLVVKEISKLTGLHVSSVHVVFKNLLSPKEEALAQTKVEENLEYTDEL